MKRQKDNKPTHADAWMERKIITGLITSKEFIMEIEPILRAGHLKTPFARKVAGWVMEYYTNFKDAPGRNIRDIYINKREEIKDDAEKWIIEEFLHSISEEYGNEGLNIDYLSKQSELYLRGRSLKKLYDELGKRLISSDVERGEELVSSFKRVTRPSSVGIDPFRDRVAINQMFERAAGDQLFKYPGDFGKMFGYFERGWFSLIVGSESRGKTFWLIDLALRSLLRGLNVVFVSFEMTRRQMLERMYHWITKLPNTKWAGEVMIPIFDCERNADDSCELSYRRNDIALINKGVRLTFEQANKRGYSACDACMKLGKRDFKPTVWHKKKVLEGMTIEAGLEKAEEIAQSVLRGKQLKLLCLPARSLSVEGLKGYMTNWAYYEGFEADVVVTDYLDKMKPDKEYGQYRHNIYDIALSHKALSLDRNILVASCSQSNTGRDEERDIKSGDVAEDIRKKAEIDIGWSLNQTAREKAQGVMRVKPMKTRHDFSNIADQCMVLYQLKIGRPILTSCNIRKYS